MQMNPIRLSTMQTILTMPGMVRMYSGSYHNQTQTGRSVGIGFGSFVAAEAAAVVAAAAAAKAAATVDDSLSSIWCSGTVASFGAQQTFAGVAFGSTVYIPEGPVDINSSVR
uniref:Uncharacterized protein n=1 Tax=Anopheles farauti TaxID=69004 RepID=A0A182PZY0_9DIPT